MENLEFYINNDTYFCPNCNAIHHICWHTETLETKNMCYNCSYKFQIKDAVPAEITKIQFCKFQL